MMKHYLPLAVLLFLIAVGTLYVFVRTPRVAVVVKLVTIPLILVAAIYGYRITDLTAGLSREVAKLPERFIYLGHMVLVNDKHEKDRIEVWIRKDKATILYSIPWTKQMEKMMDKAQQQRQGKKGAEVEMKRKGEGKEGKGSSNQEQEEDPYETNLKLPSENIPKPPQDAASQPNYSI